jgi:hypothetical protein
VYVNPKVRVVIVKFSETNHQDPVPTFRAIASTSSRLRTLAEIDRIEAQAVALH